MDARPHLRVADVFRSGWKAHHGAQCVPHRLPQVAQHIMECRTAALGGRLLRRRECRHCGRRVTAYEKEETAGRAASRV